MIKFAKHALVRFAKQSPSLKGDVKLLLCMAYGWFEGWGGLLPASSLGPAAGEFDKSTGTCVDPTEVTEQRLLDVGPAERSEQGADPAAP